MSKFTIEQARAVYQLYSRGTEPTVEQDLLVALNTVLDSAPEPQSLALRQEVALRLLVAVASSDPAEYWAKPYQIPLTVEQAFLWADTFFAHN